MGLAWATTGVGATAVPPATRTTASAARTVTLSVFIDVSSLDRLNEPGDDSRKGPNRIRTRVSCPPTRPSAARATSVGCPFAVVNPSPPAGPHDRAHGGIEVK